MKLPRLAERNHLVRRAIAAAISTALGEPELKALLPSSSGDALSKEWSAFLRSALCCATCQSSRLYGFSLPARQESSRPVLMAHADAISRSSACLPVLLGSSNVSFGILLL